MPNDQLLTQISAATSGDRGAFAALVGRYQGLVSATTLSLTGDFQRSEDLAQETFLIAWNKLSELKEPLKFPGWLCGIARNCANNWLRRTKTDPLAHSAVLEETEMIADDPAIVDPVEGASAKEEAQLVWSSLAEISPAYREPLIMFYRQGAEIAEIAAALEITEETVRQRLSRGRKLLKTEVEKTVEKTLLATRPDAAFTLAVLAAIPLSASVGCTSAQSAGLLGSGGAGAASFGSGGSGAVFLTVFGFLTLCLLSSLSTILLAAICLCGLWIAIKRSPTPETKRLMISAALDVNLIVYALPYMFIVLFNVVWYFCAILYATVCDTYSNVSLVPQYSFVSPVIYYSIIHPISLSARNFFLFSLLAGLTIYVICRWQKLLHPLAAGLAPRYPAGDVTSGSLTCDSTQPQLGASPDANGDHVRFSAFENEIQIYHNTIARFAGWRDYFRTDAGLRFKRNLTIFLVFLFYGGYYIWLHWFQLSHMAPHIDSSFVLFYITSACWFCVLTLAIQIVFFRMISHGIMMAENEAKSGIVDLGDWATHDFSPANRRRFVRSSLFLLAMVPLLLFVLTVGFDIGQNLRRYAMPMTTYLHAVSPGIYFRWMYVSTVLAPVVAFWGMFRPHLRNRIYAMFFLATAIWIFVSAEWMPLWEWEPIKNAVAWMMSETGLTSNVSTLKVSFFFYHLFAGICLAIYLPLAAWFGLRRRRP